MSSNQGFRNINKFCVTQVSLCVQWNLPKPDQNGLAPNYKSIAGKGNVPQNAINASPITFGELKICRDNIKPVPGALLLYHSLTNRI